MGSHRLALAPRARRRRAGAAMGLDRGGDAQAQGRGPAAPRVGAPPAGGGGRAGESAGGGAVMPNRRTRMLAAVALAVARPLAARDWARRRATKPLSRIGAPVVMPSPLAGEGCPVIQQNGLGEHLCW